VDASSAADTDEISPNKNKPDKMMPNRNAKTLIDSFMLIPHQRKKISWHANGNVLSNLHAKFGT
jgi:hypothetical protein